MATTADNLPSGEELRDQALDQLASRHPALVRRAQRALLETLLVHGTATADSLHALVPLPPGVDPRVSGAVPGPLMKAGIIRPAGYVRSRRPRGHCHPHSRWELVSPAAALAWVATHPELPGAEGTGDGPRQGFLF